uniref:Casein kinase I n=1 Tax=Alexandrium monilatum TaxID=311494 RepID=A0A7S4VJ77_9DINO|mmetsp:Transcript_93557/g.279244  ORF Transcript_93557/g.279244 Transcript_93557/m.279244 type:complete len:591 (+) Transcript_93557:110-1882(+)|eukprot:CAMPEP_0175581206 /NCGR_PEP_ID=MMETSP0096-20121207/47502_1 /TAXON_ID=311494 /ORGANISM="Alexandrium monilatum, Strain CCMP3105" /LENGTH=590 /DNA_ID=CAMNT_0016884841 /DNA_START=79 /DNA_END=1851 /DNA_ORIENTATION=-
MPLQTVPLTRDQAFAMQEELIAGFSEEAFRRKLGARWKAAGNDMVLQARARQEVCLEVQGPIITKFGFEASRKGAAMSVLALQAPELEQDAEITARNLLLGRLADPSKRVTRGSGRDYQGAAQGGGASGGGSGAWGSRATTTGAGVALPAEECSPTGKAPCAPAAGTVAVDIAVEASRYEGLEVPRGCTVGQWKQLLATGLLGGAVAYAERLRCHVEGAEGRGLDDAAPLPEPPDIVGVQGPPPVLRMLKLGLQRKGQPPDGRPRLGSYRLGRKLGSGIRGVCVYLAEHVTDGSEAALKWPAGRDEVRALRELERRAPVLGAPRLLALGTHRGRPFVVTELLGERLSCAFPRPRLHPLEARWRAVRVIGRLLVRRLESLHGCRYVHCDVSPENILLGSGGPPEGSSAEDPRGALCLVDFGLARPYPGGEALEGGQGSAEWSSVRSAEGGVRRPEDDLEALGWVLLHGLFGTLPWIPVLSDAYAEWSADDVREGVLGQVRRMKSQLLDYMGTGSATRAATWELKGLDWQKFAETPRELYQFFRVCQAESKYPQRPDYAALSALLGSSGELTSAGAEQQDRQDWRQFVTPLL